MNKINWKQKFTSRKFWAALSGFVLAVLTIFNVNDLTAEKVGALIAALGLLSAYIVGEGYVDGKREE